MNLNTIVKTAILASLLSAAFSHADASAEGIATGKRQHKPVTISKPIDKASPALATSLASGEVKERAAYRLCPDGNTMVQPGEKCPEKSTRSTK